ncbi:hypothetical protein Syun_015787 [Stephania yunnanensis]|uniref:Uncharacterized protein n=1 Tax=Stephania yunnanensis TaxID=152371 RepID=A0AAP0JP78_9MAGN
MTKRERSLKKKNSLCIPFLLKNHSSSKTNSGLSSPSLVLERLRDAFFRLIMLTAISKTTRFCEPPRNVGKRPAYCSPNLQQYHSDQDIADCIEFIKKTASMVPDPRREASVTTSPLPML